MRTPALTPSFVRGSLVVLLIALIGSIAFLLLVPRISLQDALSGTGPVTVVVRGITEDARFEQPILQVVLRKQALWPLMVEIPQGLRLGVPSDEGRADLVILKRESMIQSQSLILWSAQTSQNLFAYSLMCDKSWPDQNIEYGLTTKEVKPDLIGLLENINALDAEKEYAAQIAVWMTSNDSTFDQIKDDCLTVLESHREMSEKIQDPTSQGSANSLLSVVVALMVVTLALMTGHFFWRRRKIELISRLDGWEYLGEGGMAEIYVAYDKSQQPPRKVIVKFPKKELDFKIEKNIDYRFRTEAKHHQRLQHPNIVPLIESGSSKHPTSKHQTRYLIQEFIEGYTIEKLLDKQKPITERIIFEILDQLLDAIEYIHRQNVVHRDITATNVMVNQVGQVKLIDFGIATTTNSKITKQQGLPLFGTPSFYAPSSVIYGDADPARDFYALAVLIYIMFGGRLPHGHRAESAHKRITENLKLLHKIPNGVKKVLQDCLSGKYRDASRLREDLRLGHHELSEMVQNMASRQDEDEDAPEPNKLANKTTRPVEDENEDEES